jgi:hypothetical protein
MSEAENKEGGKSTYALQTRKQEKVSKINMGDGGKAPTS